MNEGGRPYSDYISHPLSLPFQRIQLLPIISVCNKKQAILIGITENLDSPLAKAAQIVVPIKIHKESDKYNVMATSSFIATIAVFDAMLVAIMEGQIIS